MGSEKPAGSGDPQPKGEIEAPVPKASEVTEGVLAQPVPPAVALPMPPPPPPGGQVQLAFGMQFMQPNALAALSPDVQKELIASMDRQDQRGYEHATERLKSQERVKCREIEDRSSARTSVVWVGGGLAVLALGAGVWVTLYLLSAGQYQWAYTMMLAGFAVVASFIGGAGFGSHIRNLFSK